MTARRWRWVRRTAVVCVVLSMGADHLRSMNRHGDDWGKFDGKTFLFDGAQGERVWVRDDSGVRTEVRLLGVGEINAEWDGNAEAWLNNSLRGKQVVLKLEGGQTRDEDGVLLASVYDEDDKLVNGELVGTGTALADSRISYSMDAVVEMAQSGARERKHGAWRTLATWQMPAWWGEMRHAAWAAPQE